MNDKHAGEAGTFYNDPVTGERLNQKEWDAQQQKKAVQKETKPKKLAE